MIRTEQGYAQIFKIYGKSETEVKEKLQDLLKCGGAVVIYTRRRGKDVHVLAETQAEDEESAKAALKPVAKEIKKALGDMYYSTKENETMEDRCASPHKVRTHGDNGGVLHRRHGGCKDHQRARCV